MFLKCIYRYSDIFTVNLVPGPPPIFKEKPAGRGCFVTVSVKMPKI